MSWPASAALVPDQRRSRASARVKPLRACSAASVCMENGPATAPGARHPGQRSIPSTGSKIETIREAAARVLGALGDSGELAGIGGEKGDDLVRLSVGPCA